MLTLLLRLVLSPATAEKQEAPRARLMRPGDIDTLPVRDAGRRIPCGTEPLQFGELRLPAGPRPFPESNVVHGGCWFSPYANVRNAAPLADAVTAGVATWNVEYRRYDPPGGEWSGTFQDVARATAASAGNVRESCHRIVHGRTAE